jgi:hypothetical protein
MQCRFDGTTYSMGNLKLAVMVTRYEYGCDKLSLKKRDRVVERVSRGVGLEELEGLCW